ncbi:MAG: hypothetical protein ACTSUD_03415 [Alphaproteobacteria bacterium]
MKRANIKPNARSLFGHGVGLALILALSACAGKSSIKPIEVSQLCTRGDRAKPIIVAHIDERGTAYLGDAPKGEYDGVVKRVASALALPRSPDYRRRVRTDCYDKAKKVWYNCVKETRADFSKIKGLSRAPKMDKARDLALQICAAAIRINSPKSALGYRFDSDKFGCTISQQSYCPVFKATSAFKAKKKALKLARKKYEGRGRKLRDDFCVSQYCLPE